MSDTSTSTAPARQFAEPQEGWIRGAQITIGRALAMVPIQIVSAIDLGCNVGAWLAALERLGITDLVGVDIEHRPGQLYGGAFVRADVSKPITLGRRFSLAIGVEVGEHLDGGEKSADAYVENLCRHSDFIIFSAAIPGQRGDHHVMERWPEWWAAKFRRNEYLTADVLRCKLWNDQRVLWWYRQNVFLAARRKSAAGEHLKAFATEPVLSLVHPSCYGRGGDGRV